MSSIGSGYDLTASQFSRGGNVFQIEYACKAVENSGTAIAIQGKDCVVFAVENIVTSKLYEPGCVKRIFNIDDHIGMVVMGFQTDAKAIVEAAREECANYRNSFGSRIPLYSLTERLAMYMHAHTLYSAVRPFGVSVLLGSYESDGPHLYVVEPSGSYFAYFGCAIGKAKQNATTEIEKLKINDLSPEELVKEAAKIIYTVHDEIKDKHFELDLSWVGANTKGIHQPVPSKLFDEAETFAKQALEEADDLDDEVE
ncbi:Proteasome subunit alpha type-3 isoform 1 [Schistosoma japonicum]|uniref:20S proteasome subunit alpha 7 n=2 Tax=Schistosoma japonicum TaxID=6182 RepID=C1LM88_SCHJA|nr:Proteasome subunit alpha type-3 [Schistosoma japonicum]TNN07988.1 Proteasome subunit alpha type-3 isoform 1 [Schistosoma japonicum]CAX70764.1 20S proteasome subunit alpha 7 [Schistosoma japonicum]CAX70765.1 20S proteasome subunit alpha 7 [Schistosoma japonicum]CAX75815.1 20S proteasome subunit alpha 7 [Schistosoma japonicum]